MVEDVNRTEQEWGDAIVCVWKIDAAYYSDTNALIQHISDLVTKINEARENDKHARMADHRTVYYHKEDHTFRVASWFCDTDVSTIATLYEELYNWKDVCSNISPLNFTYGQYFTERSTCVAECLKVADTVKGKLKRQALLENLLTLYGQGPSDDIGGSC